MQNEEQKLYIIIDGDREKIKDFNNPQKEEITKNIISFDGRTIFYSVEEVKYIVKSLHEKNIIDIQYALVYEFSVNDLKVVRAISI